MFILSAPFYNFYLFHIFTHLFHMLYSFLRFIHVSIYYALFHLYSKLNTLYQTSTLNLWETLNTKLYSKLKIVGYQKHFHSHLQSLLQAWDKKKTCAVSRRKENTVVLHEELNQGFHRLELLPFGENRCAGKTKRLRCRSKSVVVFWSIRWNPKYI